jgi:hypothetical protein
MRFKKLRLGPQLIRATESPDFFEHIHVIFGGSGAVGGATALQIISLFEEALDYCRAGTEQASPRVVITARTKQELRQFTSTLFALQQRDYGRSPTPLSGVGYQTVKGVIVELFTLDVDPKIEGLSGFSVSDEIHRQACVEGFLASGGLGKTASTQAKVEMLRVAIDSLGRPFSDFLLRYCKERGMNGGRSRLRSVVVSIPLATVASYKLSDLEAVCPYLGVDAESPVVHNLKSGYLRAMRDDLVYVAEHLADNVFAAHTTGVGGMYDEEEDGRRTIRLGFAHSPVDGRLEQKQEFAEDLTRLYAERGIKMLITAAAIGIDAILMHKTPPLNAALRRMLQSEAICGNGVIPESDLRAGIVRVYPPLDLDLTNEPNEAVTFEHGIPLVLDHVLKSGENGFFTVSNTDALYRVMRVTSSMELGLLLARTAVFGDDEGCPSFVDNVCYYTETDNSRQIFDLLSQPALRKNQLSGLQPKALQDLGSAKHQGELHTLGLLILLHRLKTLDLEAIPRCVDLRAFDPREYFDSHSQPPTLEHVISWDEKTLASELITLVTAQDEADLAPLSHYYQTNPERQKAIHRVLRMVILAARMSPSIGTPVLYEIGGRRRVVAGYYAAPLDRVITHRDTFATHLRQRFEEAGGGPNEEFEQFVEFHVANYGFADIRPLAVLVTARTGSESICDAVQVFRDEPAFIEALRRVKPYTRFTTSGLLALSVRLRGLLTIAHDLDFKLGSANEFRAHFLHDEAERPLLVPGLIEAFRMISEGLEKNTGLERLDGRWGYHVR